MGSEMCIRDRFNHDCICGSPREIGFGRRGRLQVCEQCCVVGACGAMYTSDDGGASFHVAKDTGANRDMSQRYYVAFQEQ